MTAEEVIRTLSLRPHPEGGHYAEVFRAQGELTSAQHRGPRRASTAIYFLLASHEFSAFHRVRSDELWHHYAGDALELTLLDEQGAQTLRLGSDLSHGERPLGVVPAGVWQAARPAPGSHGYALCGCTVAPGFEFEDFEMPSRAALLALLPAHRERIVSLTRE
ncbi:MAG: cupin domain-containing protein [Polyangiaceae bacterium]